MFRSQYNFIDKLQVSTYIKETLVQWIRSPTPNTKANGSNPGGGELKYFYIKNIFIKYLLVKIFLHQKYFYHIFTIHSP